MVLLLDADDDFRAALTATLLDDGHAVRAFGRPADVPSLASFSGLSMLIVDQQLQGESGLAFADRFHAAHPGVPVVMVAAYVSRFLADQAARRRYLTLRRKPVDYEELARLLPQGK